MRKTIKGAFVTMLLAMAIVKLEPSPSIAGVKEDAEKAEKEIEIQELIRRVEENTYNRAKRAVLQTNQAQDTIKSCKELSKKILNKNLEEEYKKYKEFGAYETLEDYLWSECLREQWPFKQAFDKLYKEFWSEEVKMEIERTYKDVEEPERKKIGKAVQQR